MSMKVALLAILALFSATNAQLIAVTLPAQSSLSASCTSSGGCSLLTILGTTVLASLNGNSLLDFSAYSGVNINFDNSLLNLLIGAVNVTGTNNIVSVTSSATINNVNVGSTNTLAVSSSSTLTTANSIQASGSVLVGAGSAIAVGANNFIYQNAGNITLAAGAAVTGSIQVGNSAYAYIGASASSTASAATVSAGVIINGVATFGQAAVTGAITVGSSASASASANIAVTVTATTSTSATFTASAQSTVTVNAGAAIVAAGAVSSQGSVVVAGYINSTTSYTQQASASGSANTASNLQLSNGGSVNVASNNNVNIAGSLSGVGSITGNLVVTGTLNIGNSPGTVFVNGNYNPSDTSTFNLEIASSTNFDKLIVSGTATLSGVLNCILLDGYQPGPNTRFQFITAQSVTKNYIIVHGTGSNFAKWTNSVPGTSSIANYNSAVSVAVSGLLVVACLLAALL